MRNRLVPVAAIAVAATLAAPAIGATPKPSPQIVDPVGDANALNDQDSGLGAPPDTATAPADVASADITGVRFATRFVTRIVVRHGKRVKTKVPTDTLVTMTLAAPPTDPAMSYRVLVSMPGCDQLFIDYSTDVAIGGTSVSCPNVDPSHPTAASPTYDVDDAVVSGNTITWDLPVSEIRAGTKFTGLAAETRGAVLVTAPELDYASSTTTFTVGK